MNGSSLRTWVAIATLAIALITAVIVQDRAIQARQTQDQVEHTIDLKVSASLAEIIRILDKLDHRLDRLEGLDRPLKK